MWRTTTDYFAEHNKSFWEILFFLAIPPNSSSTFWEKNLAKVSHYHRRLFLYGKILQVTINLVQDHPPSVPPSAKNSCLDFHGTMVRSCFLVNALWRGRDLVSCYKFAPRPSAVPIAFGWRPILSTDLLFQPHVTHISYISTTFC